MEEPHDSVRPWLDAGEVGTFDQVAIGTGQGQVLRVVSAAMLPRDNVLNVKAQF
jgi:alkylated DNA nucleotide flippase Atl1